MTPASLRPLRSRNFALLWSAALVSNVGSWMQTVALGVVVTVRTHDPLWTGAVAAAAFIPLGVLAPVGGALADRLDRRRWLVVTTLGETAAASVLAVLAAGHAPALAMVAMAFVGGTCAAVGFPAYQAMLPDLVPRDELLAAVSLSSAQFNLGRVVGPALAGIVLAVGSASWAFVVNAASFGAVVAALLLIRLPAPEATPSTEGMVARMVDGARIAFSEPGCRSAIGLIAVVALIGSPFIALVPAVAIEALHRGSTGTSVLVTAQGVGAVVGALSLAWMARVLGRSRLLVRALLAFPAALLLYGAASSLVAAALAIVAVGAAYIGVLSGLNTVVQLRAPVEARGRVLGLYMMALGTIYPVGAVCEGALARAAGIHAVTMGAGALLAVIVLAVLVLAPSVASSLDDASISEAPAEVPEVAGEVLGVEPHGLSSGPLSR